MILLDVGDVFGGSGEEGRRKAEVTIAAMELMSYDALNLGEGEFLFGRSFLEEQRERVSFPFLSANLVAPDSGEHPYAAYVVEEAGHLKVGIIGLVSPELYRGHELVAQDPAATLRTLLPEVKEEAHFVVVLAQMGYAEAVELIRIIEGISVMVIGDAGESATEPVEINGALLVQCTHWGMAVGELQVTGNTDGQVIDYQWRSGVLDEQITDDPQMVELMNRYGE
ncbi:MAG TPA: bifunctional metallophosphatase/5'-nucleotidase [Chloroflexi bacterium]|nr:bifunctional metallophosphatase/5'-nucleotidase [Chloroflexota bacterium]